MLKPTILAILALAAPLAAQPLAAQGVSPEGRLLRSDSRARVHSPGGMASAEVLNARGGVHALRGDVLVRREGGAALRVANVLGDGFLVTDAGELVALHAGHRSSHVSVSVYGTPGQERYSFDVPSLRDATLGSDSRSMLYGAGRDVLEVDLATGRRIWLGEWARFAGGPQGLTAGTEIGQPTSLVVRQGRRVISRLDMSAPIEQLAFDPSGEALYLRTNTSLLRLAAPFDGQAKELQRAAPGAQLRDLWVTSDGVRLGVSQLSPSGQRRGSVLLQSAGAGFRLLTQSASAPTTAANLEPVPLGSIQWPLAPMGPYGIGNTYGEYQRYGNTPYLHPGIDVFGNDLQPVYSVSSGVVKAVLTTSGSYHWRVAIAPASSGTSEGYLYAHLDQPTIAVQVGDVITVGQYLGDLVPWPVSGFTHTHFARIESSGNQWFGDWLCTTNPHMELYPKLDSAAPQFESAVGNQLFAFTANQSSNYQNPSALVGAVDVIAHVSDIIETSYECAVQGLRYSIHPAGDPNNPVVPERLAFHADMALDTYQNGPIDPFLVDLLYKQDSTCQTEGDYGSREFFHILTNSNGDEVYSASDLNEAWDTNLLSDGDYVIVVTAWDVAGNSTTASMTVTTANGNP
ncbi:MAG: murein DD-endopeptidase MepM/ murein hydrolase activator NlpD [Planctomycetota bacterium]|jgi:murein DD-endopeptidase MepM/ murein hydrolase activator NlpD